MTNPEAIPFHEFKIAVTKRLGLNPDEASMIAWGDDGHVDVRFYMPVDEIWAILNGGEGDGLAGWERELLATQEMTDELRKTRAALEAMNVQLNRTARASRLRTRDE